VEGTYYSIQWYLKDKVVGIATDCWLDDRRVGVRVPVEARLFSSLFRPTMESTLPPMYWIPADNEQRGSPFSETSEIITEIHCLTSWKMGLLIGPPVLGNKRT
jgi:hypothetical protein